MASLSVFASVATLLFLHPLIVRSDFLSPFFSPIFDDICKEVECGKGTCKPSQNSSLFYECQCDHGWKQARSDDAKGLNFLPCILPNCSLDSTCMAPPSPAQNRSRANESIFDPCYWTDCGVGSCNKTSTFTYSCACAEGYYNLLNVSALPCLKECAIGMDCADLGITMSNKSASPTPALADNGTGEARTARQVSIHWLMILLILLPMILWI